ncbi:unnamed protein product, partial [Ectocarpus sp. 4 AP-2014]
MPKQWVASDCIESILHACCRPSSYDILPARHVAVDQSHASVHSNVLSCAVRRSLNFRVPKMAPHVSPPTENFAELVGELLSNSLPRVEFPCCWLHFDRTQNDGNKCPRPFDRRSENIRSPARRRPSKDEQSHTYARE